MIRWNAMGGNQIGSEEKGEGGVRTKRGREKSKPAAFKPKAAAPG